MHAHLTSLMEHHKFASDQHKVLGELIEEGSQNQVAVVGAIAAIKGAAAFAAAKGPIIQGAVSIFKNVVWGGDVAKKTIDPKKIDASFDNAAKFNAEIAKRFPKSYAIVHELRTALKAHHFDLSNTIQDVALLADSTKFNVNKTIKKLNLRQKFVDAGRMKERGPLLDLKVWTYTIRRQVTDLEDSMAKCDTIIKILTQLQKDVGEVKDKLDAELEKIRGNLESHITGLRAKMADLEQQLKATGCINNSAELLRAIFTLGIACTWDNPTKVKLQNARTDLHE